MVHAAPMKFCVLVLVHLFVVHARIQLADEDDEECKTPNQDVGVCINIYSCAPIMDVLDTVPRPISPRIATLLKRYQCGFSGRNPKVCCPNKPIDLEPPEPPKVEGHKNVDLLPKNCGSLETDDKTLTGDKTVLFEFPWMALLSYRTSRGPQFKCGASVINSRYILTAAHCITGHKIPLIGVRVGEHNIRTKEDCELLGVEERICAPPVHDIAIEEIIPHPEYDAKSFRNDIGLLRTATPIDLSQEHIRSICLPLNETRNYNFTNRNCIVTGWGVSETGVPRTELRKVQIPVLSQQQCIDKWANKTTINHRQMCAGGNARDDTCAGDGGGPLQVVAYLHQNYRWVQQGIVSFGAKLCGKTDLPGVYTKIAYYMDWILDNLRE